MKITNKGILSLLLCLVMLFSIGTAALAEGEEDEGSGSVVIEEAEITEPTEVTEEINESGSELQAEEEPILYPVFVSYKDSELQFSSELLTVGEDGNIISYDAGTKTITISGEVTSLAKPWVIRIDDSDENSEYTLTGSGTLQVAPEGCETTEETSENGSIKTVTHSSSAVVSAGAKVIIKCGELTVDVYNEPVENSTADGVTTVTEFETYGFKGPCVISSVEKLAVKANTAAFKEAPDIAENEYTVAFEEEASTAEVISSNNEILLNPEIIIEPVPADSDAEADNNEEISSDSNVDKSSDTSGENVSDNETPLTTELTQGTLSDMPAMTSEASNEGNNVAVESVAFSPDSGSVAVGSTLATAVTVLPEGATEKGVTYSSSDETKATVDESGVITGVEAGSATITATAKDGSNVFGTFTVTVTAAPVKVTGITITDAPASILVGKTVDLSKYITVTPDTATDPTVSYSTSDTSIATVSDAGVVTAVKKGTAKITVTAKDGSGITATYEPAVTIPVSSIDMTDGYMLVGKVGYLTCTVKPTDADNQTLGWSSSDPSLATVDSSTGYITSLQPGTVQITAVAQDGSEVEKTVNLTIYSNPESVTVSPTSALFSTLGGTKTLTATVSPATARQKVIYSSSDTNIATVDETTGRVTAVGNGIATIYARSADNSNVYGTCTVTVSISGGGTKLSTYQSSRAWYYDSSTRGDYTIATQYGSTDSGLALYVDNNLVSTSNYYQQTTSSSTYPSAVTLRSSYMQALGAGRHYFYVRYSNGSYADGYFYCRSVYDAPLTGDSNQLALWSAVCTISLLTSFGAVTVYKKSKNNSAK